jgi:hypothetical protein
MVLVCLSVIGLSFSLRADTPQNNGEIIEIGGEVFGCGQSGDECYWQKPITQAPE